MLTAWVLKNHKVRGCDHGHGHAPTTPLPCSLPTFLLQDGRVTALGGALMPGCQRAEVCRMAVCASSRYFSLRTTAKRGA